LDRTYRRNYERYRLPDKEMLPCEGLDRPLTGHVAVLGLGGMFVRTVEPYEPGTLVSVRLHAEEGVVETAAVVRYRGPGGLGLEFVALRGQSDLNLRKILRRLSTRQAPVA